MSVSKDCNFIFPFATAAPAAEQDNDVMGVKGGNLAAMAKLGLPVPPGFIVSTGLGKRLAADGASFSAHEQTRIHASIGLIEEEMGRTFGGSDAPLLVSVRSGAAVSMPGMMDTVLNLGLNNKTVEALAKATDDRRFAWDSYRRFIQSYAEVVLGLEPYPFEDVLEEAREKNGVDTDAQLNADTLEGVAHAFQSIVEANADQPFPQDVYHQLDGALMAVFRSWNTPRAIRYRDMQKIDHDGGTAAVVQSMVFGNRDDKSCTGVYFTRNPSTGENKAYGEYLPNAQGEDVVSGFRTPRDLTEEDRARSLAERPSMETTLPEAYRRLLQIGGDLEKHFADMQEVEFTVESKRLFILQTRSGKRTPKAALKIAVDMAEEGLISRAEAVARCPQDMISAMQVSKVHMGEDATLVTKGLPASPGAACGQVVFHSDAAVELREQGKPCILVRPETDPKDVHGMDAADGILTSRGGMTSHAAVVARGMNKPCITAAMTLKIDIANETATCMNQSIRAGDTITLDGGTGKVYLGAEKITVPEPDGALAVLMDWRSEE